MKLSQIRARNPKVPGKLFPRREVNTDLHGVAISRMGQEGEKITPNASASVLKDPRKADFLGASDKAGAARIGG